MRRKKVDAEILTNWWLNKFHNTNIEEVLEKHPDAKEDPKWFLNYKVTKEQDEEWQQWAKEYLRKECKFTKREIERGFGLIGLQLGPSVIYESNEQ